MSNACIRGSHCEVSPNEVVERNVSVAKQASMSEKDSNFEYSS